MSADGPNVFIHLDNGRSPTSWSKAYHSRRVLEEWPYGYQFAREYLRLTYSKDTDEPRLGRFIRRALCRVVGFDIIHALRNLDGLRNAEVIWTHTEHEHLAIAILQKVGLVPRVPIVGQTIWLWDSWKHFGPVRRLLHRWLLAEIDVHTTLSSHNAAYASQELRQTALVVPFGIEPTFTVSPRPSPRDSTRINVVAPGNDRHRDWDLLADVARLNPDIVVRVLSSRFRARRLVSRSVPNFQVVRITDTADLIHEYCQSDVVAVPLRQNAHASGLTVALEALQAGRPLVITRTGGVDDYLHDKAWYAQVGDADSLAKAIRSAAPSAVDGEAMSRQRAHITDSGLTARDYGLRHAVLTDRVLGRRAFPDSVSASDFVPVKLPS
jgi:glycosyltransferase involved in cell wall biosynthesis